MGTRMGKIYIQRIDDKKGRILVFMEKHGNRYFLAETKEQVYDACLKILKERAWMFVEPKEPELEDEHQDMVFEPGSIFEKTQVDIIKRNQNKILAYNETMNQYKLARFAVDQNNGRIAWRVINDRYDHEYERYDFEHLENV
jgi:hypothetical protein